jgi:hypothetical protein
MSGSPAASAGTLTAQASSVPNQPGIFFHARNGIQVPFGNGFLCVSAGTVRGLVVIASGNAASYAYDNSSNRRSLLTFACSTRRFQFWHRDPMAGGAGYNTTDAIAVSILP